MPRVLLAGYSRFFDVSTNTQFDPILDRRSGCYVAVAMVSKADAKKFGDRADFEVLTDEQYIEITTAPEPEDPDEPETGDPIGDAAAAKAAADATANGGQPSDANGQPQPPGPPKPPASS